MSHLYHTPIPQLTPVSDATLRSAFGEIDKGVTRALNSGTSLPATPVAGEQFWHTTDNELYVYDGKQWRVSEYPIRAEWWHHEMYVKAGNAINHQFSGTWMFGQFSYQQPSAIGDILLYNVVLKSGITYEIDFGGLRGPSAGITTLTFKHSSDVSYSPFLYYPTIDWYNANWEDAIEFYNSWFATTKDGIHTIKFETTGKNASSSGYDFRGNLIKIQPSIDV